MARAIGLCVESVENMVDDFGRYSPALIRDLEDHLFATAHCCDGYGLAGRGEADCIGQQVEQNLAQSVGIGMEAACAGRHDNIQMDVRFGQPVLNAFGAGRLKISAHGQHIRAALH